MKQIPAYSSVTKKSYDSWDDLVEAEANGWAVILVGYDPNNIDRMFANKVGSRPTKAKARSLAARFRKQCRSREKYVTTKYKVFVRPDWNWQ